jgi:hypothetical protein
MKQARTLVRSFTRSAAAALAVATLAAPMLAQAQDDGSPQATYRQERAECMAGRTTQSRALCLYDAGLALEAAREGRLEVTDAGERERNRLARCDSLPQDARDSCQRIARGEGEREGSVEAGIVVMWLPDAETTTALNTAPQ